MAIAFDATTQADKTAATSWTLAHTVTGSNPVLLVGINDQTDATDSVTGVTYNGVAMTRVALVQNATNTQTNLYVYFLPNPATGANNVVVSFSGSRSGQVRAASYTGAANSQPEASNTANNANSSALSCAVTTLTDNAWVIGFFVASLDGGAAGSGTTLRGTNDRAALYESSSNPITPTALTTLNFTATANPAWTNLACVMSVAPFAATSMKDMLGTGYIPFLR